MPETLSYNDGRNVIRFNFWSDVFTFDDGTNMDNVTLSGLETDKQSLNWLDAALDVGDEITLAGFNNLDINGVWVAESFSYTKIQPGLYGYSISLERVR